MNNPITISAPQPPAVSSTAFTTQLINEIKNTLLHPGNADLSPAAYDTAWVARIPDDQDPAKPMFPQCLQWLQDHQHGDGSWGSRLHPAHYYDNVICTLAAVVTCKIWQDKGIPLNDVIRKGTDWLNRSIKCLHQNKYRTVGFEIVFPSLFQEALAWNIQLVKDPVIDEILAVKEKKLKKINFDALFQKPTTLLHSLEGIPLAMINWDKIIALQDNTGSFLTSPATTAFVYIHTGNAQCLKYLKKVLVRYGYIPAGYPLDIFETGWCLEIISKLGLTPYFENLYENKINMLKAHWSDTKGISWSSAFNLPDLDDTAVAYYLLNSRHLHPAATVFENFYKDGHLFCFPGELDSSPTHLLHFLQAYNGNDLTLTDAAKDQLMPLLNADWTDKWHLSPYYLTSIAVEPLLKATWFDATTIIDFVLQHQHTDGGWGMHVSNAEETGWACMTLMVYLQHCHEKKALIEPYLQKGIHFLVKERTAPVKQEHLHLWIEKCLYTPYNIVNTLTNAVLLKFHLANQLNIAYVQ